MSLAWNRLFEMNSHFMFVGIFLFADCAWGDRESELRKIQEKELGIMKTCNEKFHAPEENFHYIMDSDDVRIGNSTEVKCLMNCLLTNLKLHRGDGSFDLVEMDTFFSNAYASQENAAHAKAQMRICVAKAEQEGDLCEGAYQYFICYFKETNKLNVPGPHGDKL